MLFQTVLLTECSYVFETPSASLSYCNSNEIVRNVIIITDVRFPERTQYNSFFLSPIVLEGITIRLDILDLDEMTEFSLIHAAPFTRLE